MFSRSVSKVLLLAATAGLAAGCSGVAGSSGPQSAGRSSAGTRAATPQQAVQLAAAYARQATSVTANVTVQGTGTTAMSLSGTVEEQTRPDLMAEASFPGTSLGGQSIPGGLTEIVTTKAAYLRFSALRGLTGGKAWLELPYSELSTALGGFDIGQIIQQAQDNSPLVQTQMLAGATNVRKVGTSTVNGVPVTEYTGSYSVSAAVAQLPASTRAVIEQDQAKAGIKSVTFDVWLDGQQQARKLIVTEHGGVENLTISMVVTSFNQPVNIQVPPAAQTASVPLSDLTLGN